MAVSYKRLWKLLIDKDMKKDVLCRLAGISTASVTKMGRNGYVTTDVLDKICLALECDIEDVMEIVKEQLYFYLYGNNMKYVNSECKLGVQDWIEDT